MTLLSNNALDSANHAHRPVMRRELARVTRPGGYVAVSTLRRGGGSHREVPIQLTRTNGRQSIRDVLVHNLELFATRRFCGIGCRIDDIQKITDHG